jgi:hypothetical protein
MNITPTITGIRLASHAPRNPGSDICLAILTVEYGPWVIGGVRFCSDSDGNPFLKPPITKGGTDRVILRAGPERDFVIAEAQRLFLGMHLPTAETPLATAPSTGVPHDGNC